VGETSSAVGSFFFQTILVERNLDALGGIFELISRMAFSAGSFVFVFHASRNSVNFLARLDSVEEEIVLVTLHAGIFVERVVFLAGWELRLWFAFVLDQVEFGLALSTLITRLFVFLAEFHCSLNAHLVFWVVVVLVLTGLA
jgi:hypothetical protein